MSSRTPIASRAAPVNASSARDAFSTEPPCRATKATTRSRATTVSAAIPPSVSPTPSIIAAANMSPASGTPRPRARNIAKRVSGPREQGLESDRYLFSADPEKAAYVDHHADDPPGRVDGQIIDRSDLLLVGTLDRSPEIFGRKQRGARLLDDVETARGRRRRRLPQ